MKIGLIDIELKIFNTAYMQISQYHKRRGDTVEWWTPLEHRGFDVVYCSSLFDYTDKSEVPDDAICGGTGFDISSKLSVAMEGCDLDYSIYPQCRKSYLWFSRGCFRNCPFCCVRQKEGTLKPVNVKNLNPYTEVICIQDNNFFANPQWRSAIKWLQAKSLPVEFLNIDARIIDKEQAESILTLKHQKQIKIAWDNPKENLIPKLRQIIKWIKPYRLMCYVLIGYWSTPEEDMHRVEMLRELGIDPFVMPYNKKDLYQRAFARWVNHKAIFKKVKWKDYKQRVIRQELAGTGWCRGR